MAFANSTQTLHKQYVRLMPVKRQMASNSEYIYLGDFEFETKYNTLNAGMINPNRIKKILSSKHFTLLVKAMASYILGHMRNLTHLPACLGILTRFEREM